VQSFFDSEEARITEDIEDTKNSLSADEQFLLMLKERCSMTDKEWEARQKTRQEEMKAVSDALAVLSSDDAHDTFTRTFNPSLLQEESFKGSDRRVAASNVLSALAKKVHNPRLATLAEQVWAGFPPSNPTPLCLPMPCLAVYGGQVGRFHPCQKSNR